MRFENVLNCPKTNVTQNTFQHVLNIKKSFLLKHNALGEQKLQFCSNIVKNSQCSKATQNSQWNM